MNSSPAESLQELPQPFDISTAVSLALRFHSPPTISCNPLEGSPPNFFQSDNEPNRGNNAVHCQHHYHHHHHHHHLRRLQHQHRKSLQPVQEPRARSDRENEAGTSSGSYLCPLDSPYQIELDAWSESTVLSASDIFDTDNEEQLDRFCKYIDSSADEDVPAALRMGPLGRPVIERYHKDEHRYSYRHYPHNHHTHKRKKKNPTPLQYAGCSGETSEGLNFDDYSTARLIPLEPDRNPNCPWKVELANCDLWRTFDQIGTEMVITKNGRRMFPSLSYTISKLQADQTYTVRLNILPVDSRRYKFLQTEWVPVGRADKKSLYKEYVHPESPNTGAFWMEKTVLFKLVKLTNNKSTPYSDQIILNSMQKYQPILKITCDSDGGMTQSFRFVETTFIAVTAYQNHNITELKIENNPYARAFRETIPSNGQAPERKGGHWKRNTVHCKLQTDSTADGPLLRSVSPAIMIPDSTTASNPTTATVYSSPTVGVELGLCSPENHLILSNETDITKEDDLYECSLNFWTEDSTFYDHTLLSSPMLAASGSFSEPYLQHSPIQTLESTVSSNSPTGNHSFIDDVDSVNDIFL